MPAVEGRKRLADPRAAANTLRQQRHALHRTRGVAFAQRGRDVNEARMKYEGLRLAEIVENAVHEAQEHGRIHAHGAGSIEQHDQTQRFVLALSPHQFHRRAAMCDALVNRAAQIDAAARTARLLAAGQPHAHGPCEPCRNRMRLGKIGRIGEMTEIGLGQRL